MNSVAALLIFLLLRFPSPTSTHHIVFEEIGEMAGALSYIHAVIPVNISGLDHRPTPFAPKSTTFAGITTSLKPTSIRQ
jgi:hypothetical protein